MSRAEHGSAADPWIRALSVPRASRLQLICFPFAGGGTAPYVPWQRHLSPDVELCAVRLPGRESRRAGERHVVSMAPLVEALADALARRVERPYVFFGHSMGAAIAYELCVRLRALGMPLPRHLFVSARPASAGPARLPPIHVLPDGPFLAALRERYAAIPQEVLDEPELLALVIPTLRADFELIETYRHAACAPLPCPITALGGRRDPLVTEADLAAWAGYTSIRFAHTILDGDHFFLNKHAGPLVSTLMRSLEPEVGS